MNAALKIIQLTSLYQLFGDSDYIGEEVSQQTHALQAGTYALQQHFKDTLVVAALFHDIGHLLGHITHLPHMIEEKMSVGVKYHELIGAHYLHLLGFPLAVTVPIAQHVQVKRYLRHKHPEYELSAGSEASLKAQGGAMSAQEAKVWEESLGEDMVQDCISLRLCEDHAKDPSWKPLSWEAFEPIIQKVFFHDLSITQPSSNVEQV